MNSITSDDIKRHYPLITHLEREGIRLIGGGDVLTCNRCAIRQHKKDHQCVTVWRKNQTWHCNDCDQGGSIVDWIAIEKGQDPKTVYRDLAKELEAQHPSFQKPTPEKPKEGVITATYAYLKEDGSDAYEVVRYEPKDFRQRHKVNGQWVWDMKGVERVLYNLPAVLANQEVWIVEGEKDADNLTLAGFTATCNVGGAGKWLDGYTQSLLGKDVILCGDTDEAGQKHITLVSESLAGKVNSTRTVQIPAPHKDVSDFIQSLGNPFEASEKLAELRDKAQRLTRGVDVKVYSLAEIEPRYIQHLQAMQSTALNLSAWLPSLQHRVRSIVPGEVITFIADTGVGKTALLCNLALHSAPLITLLFELELPETLVYERLMSAAIKMPCRTFEQTSLEAAKVGEHVSQEVFNTVNHIYVNTQSRLTVAQMETLIAKSELKIGAKPALVLVDYIQLVNADGKSRYEKASASAEELKVLAKSANVILVIASQIARKRDDQKPIISLHEAKDSGSIENSSGLVIGAWREPDEKDTIWLQILKNTKGSTGQKIECNFNGETMRITERTHQQPTTTSSSDYNPPEQQGPHQDELII